MCRRLRKLWGRASRQVPIAGAEKLLRESDKGVRTYGTLGKTEQRCWGALPVRKEEERIKLDCRGFRFQLLFRCKCVYLKEESLVSRVFVKVNTIVYCSKYIFQVLNIVLER